MRVLRCFTLFLPLPLPSPLAQTQYLSNSISRLNSVVFWATSTVSPGWVYLEPVGIHCLSTFPYFRTWYKCIHNYSRLTTLCLLTKHVIVSTFPISVELIKNSSIFQFFSVLAARYSFLPFPADIYIILKRRWDHHHFLHRCLDFQTSDHCRGSVYDYQNVRAFPQISWVRIT